MQLKPITPIIVLLLVVASISVAGCSPPIASPSPSPTPTAAPTIATPTDYSSVFASSVESGNFIVTRPFTKSTNERGNDVYKGVGRNATLSGSKDVTLVFELTGTKAEAKQVYDKVVATKIKEGYTPDASITVSRNHEAFWVGTYGSNWVYCAYGYGPEVPSWTVLQQSS
jgi:hypothetical protein